jgi:DNA-binding transcriptional ArsR family regulator
VAKNLDALGVATAPEPTDEADNLVLNSPEQFKALGHPLRHQLINVLRQRPATLGQLATALESTKGTIGYHVKMLVDAGLLRPAQTRTVRGGTEQYFEPVGSGYRPELPGTGAARFLVNAALAEMVPGEPEETMLTHLRLTPGQARNLIARLADIAHERPAEEHPSEPYGLLLSVYRTDVPQLPSDG